ncbi:Self-incomp_S1 domain-containing protein, partial [Cephalotus follicularis]
KVNFRILSNVTSPVTIHCKSRDDDLGWHVISKGNFVKWWFRLNFWETTLYFCGITTQYGGGVYDIYKAKRDMKRCHFCNWVVQQDGVHGFKDGANKDDIWFKW